MQTILVTGGAGFIGGAFVRQTLAEGGARVVNLDRLTYAGNLDSLADAMRDPRHVFVQGDIRDGGLVRRLLAEHQPTAIVHFAAESHVDRSIGAPAGFVQTNVVGTFELLAASLDYWEKAPADKRAAFRFMHVSTDEVYGSLGPTGKFMETTPYAPNSPYSASKAASDHFVRAYHHTYGLPVVTTNCSNNYGPYQFPEKLIPLMILNAIEGKPLPVYGDGGNIRDWLHVSDHTRALRLCLEKGRLGEVYNIGGDSERTNLQIVHAICATVDRLCPDLAHRPTKNLIRFVTDRPGHDRRYAIDSGKLARELGWRPQVEFESGIEETVRWYLENRTWVERIHSGGYQRERLGLRGAPADGFVGATPAAEYREGPIDGIDFKPLKHFRDPRGWLVELHRNDEMAAENQPVMSYVSQTMPGVTRGPHEHVDQADYFAFVGPGDFRLHLWDSRPNSPTFGYKMTRVVGDSDPRAVVVPPGVVHAYRCVSDQPGWVFNLPNRLYAGWGKSEPVDEIRHEDKEGSPYRLDPT